MAQDDICDEHEFLNPDGVLLRVVPVEALEQKHTFRWQMCRLRRYDRRRNLARATYCLLVRAG